VEHCLWEVGMWKPCLDAEEWGEWTQEMGELAPFAEPFEENGVRAGALAVCSVRDVRHVVGHSVK